MTDVPMHEIETPLRILTRQHIRSNVGVSLVNCMHLIDTFLRNNIITGYVCWIWPVTVCVVCCVVCDRSGTR